MLNHDSSRRLAAVTIVALAFVSIMASQAALAAVIANYPAGPTRGGGTSTARL